MNNTLQYTVTLMTLIVYNAYFIKLIVIYIYIYVWHKVFIYILGLYILIYFTKKCIG